MRSLKSLLNTVRMRLIRGRAGVLATIGIAALLLCGLQTAGRCDTVEVYLGSMFTGFVNVTAYLQTDQYGNVWVVGYNGEQPFEIVENTNTGQVLDPFGNQVGMCYITP